MPAGITFALSIAGGGLTYKALDGALPSIKGKTVEKVVKKGGKATQGYSNFADGMSTYFDTSSPVDGAVFWSGNKEGAATYAHPNGYVGKVWSNIEKPILEENDIIIQEVIIDAK